MNKQILVLIAVCQLFFANLLLAPQASAQTKKTRTPIERATTQVGQPCNFATDKNLYFVPGIGNELCSPSNVVIKDGDGGGGAAGTPGTNGTNGINGKNTLTLTTTESAGANCANGGSKLDVGLDKNANGILETIEIESTKYICNGIVGATGPPTNRNKEVNSQASGYTTLPNALTTIGTTQTTLNINTPQICSTAIVVPQTTALEFTNTGKIVWSTGCTLTIYGKIIAERIKILEGFTKDNLQVAGATDKIYPAWYGSVGDYRNANGTINTSPTDNYAPVQLMFDTVNNLSGSGYSSGGHILFDAKQYYFSNTLQVSDNFLIEGASQSSTVLQFGSNTSGIRFNAQDTEDGNIKPANRLKRTALESSLRNLTLRGTIDPLDTTHNVNIAANLVVTRTSADITTPKPKGGNFESLSDTNGHANTLNTGVSSGYTVNFNGMDWVIKSRDNDNQATLFPFRLTVTRNTANTIAFQYPSLTPAQASKLAGGKIVFSGNAPNVAISRDERTIISASFSGGFTILGFSGADLPVATDSFGNVTQYSGDAEITGLNPANFTAIDVRFNRWSGIDNRVKINVENVSIEGFPGHGIRNDSGAYPAVQFDQQPNQNNSKFTNISVQGNAGAGIYARGLNANHINFVNFDSGNNGLSIYESSFLGNNYDSYHANADRQGVWMGVNPTQGFTTFGSHVNFGYVEGGQPSVLLGQTSHWVDGDVGADFASYYTGVPTGFYNGVHSNNGSPDYIGLKSFDGFTNVQIGTPRGVPSSTLLAFGAQNDSFATTNNGNPLSGAGNSYFLHTPRSFSILDNALHLEYGGKDANVLTKTPFVLTASAQSATYGVGRMIFPNGFYLGVPTAGATAMNYAAAIEIKGTDAGATINKDLAFTDNTHGLIIQSDTGNKYRLTISSDGLTIRGVLVSGSAAFTTAVHKIDAGHNTTAEGALEPGWEFDTFRTLGTAFNTTAPATNEAIAPSASTYLRQVYATPGGSAEFTITGFTAGQAVRLEIFTQSPTAANGTWTANYLVNGTAVESNVDALVKAGNVQDKGFRLVYDVTANASGNVVFRVNSLTNYPTIAAIRASI